MFICACMCTGKRTNLHMDVCTYTHTYTHKHIYAQTCTHTRVFCSPGVNGVQMFGVGHDAVVYLVEQLAGAAHCRQYKFRYQKHELPEDEVCPCLVWCCCLW